MKYTIDAKNKKLGRIASEAAMILMGKNKADFRKNTIADAEVEIINASLVSITAKKMKDESHQRYSGYPGGLKKPSLEKVVANKGYSELFKHAIHGMLPGNKLRARLMTKLTISE